MPKKIIIVIAGSLLVLFSGSCLVIGLLIYKFGPGAVANPSEKKEDAKRIVQQPPPNPETDKKGEAKDKDGSKDKDASEPAAPKKKPKVETEWRDIPNVSAEENAILKKLFPYKARHELDKKSRVVRVVLEGKQVTDDALNELPMLPHLKRLSLAKSSITDAGLVKVQEIKNLENLGITDTSVTDDGLKSIEKVKTLRNVWLMESDKLTKHGIQSLRKALPDANVHVMNQAPPVKTPDPKAK